MTVCQKDREPLDLIREFLAKEFPGMYLQKVHGPYNAGKECFVGWNNQTYIQKGLHTFSVAGKKSLSVLVHLMPYLRNEKLYRAAERLVAQNLPLPKVLPIDEVWIAGFWEGDGSIYIAYPNIQRIQTMFSQKDASILTEVKTFLTRGRIYTRKNKHTDTTISRLIVDETLQKHPTIDTLLKHTKTLYRKHQIVDVLALTERTQTEMLQRRPKRPEKQPYTPRPLGRPKKFLL